MTSKTDPSQDEVTTPRVLYRKYRPTSLSDVVGQEQVTTVLDNSLKQGKVGHAYLFIGPRGTGKTSVARIFAHAVNDFPYNVEDHYLDIIEIDAASNTGVDNIRELREKAVIAPTKGKYKVYIIDEVHMLTKSASNALLKTLEEPPEHVIFIMATTDAYKVPITISSRTQVHTFRLANPEVMQKHLRQISDQEGIKITDDALKIIIRRGGGSFRDSLSLLDQISTLSDDEITATLLENSLGLPQEQVLKELLTSFANHDTTKIHQLLKDLLNTGIKPETIASELINLIIKDPQPSCLPLLAKLPDIKDPFAEARLLLVFLNVDCSVQKVVNSSIENLNPKPPKTSIRDRIAQKHAQKTSLNVTPDSSPSVPETPKPIQNETNPASTAEVKPINSQNFAWEAFLERVQTENSAAYNQIRSADYDFDGETLHIYPASKIAKSILEKPTYSQALVKCLDGIKLNIQPAGSKPYPEDSPLSKISAIMGGIQEIKGEMPF